MARFTSFNFFLEIGDKKTYPGMAARKLKKFIRRAYENRKDNEINVHTAVNNSKGKAVPNDENEITVSQSNFFSTRLDSSTKEVKSIF